MGPVNEDTLQIEDQSKLFGYAIGTIFVASVSQVDGGLLASDGKTYKNKSDYEVVGNEVKIKNLRPFLTTEKPNSNSETSFFFNSSEHPANIAVADEIESWFALKIEKLKDEYAETSEDFKLEKDKLQKLIDSIASQTKFTFGDKPENTFPTLELMINPPKVKSLEELEKNKKGGKLGGANISDFIKSNYPRPTVANSGFHVDEDLWILLIRNVLRKENTMIIGPTGTGKTELISLVANAVGYNFYTQDMGTVIDASSTLQGVHRIKDGKSIFDFAPYAKYIADEKSIILLDELNRSSLASRNILFPQLDNRRYLPIDSAEEGSARQIKVHEDNAFFATANIGAEYSGTSEIDRALLDRFFPVELDYLTTAQERNVLKKRVGIDSKQADAIVSVLNNLRQMAQKEEISSSVSMRHGLQVASLVKDGFPINRALEYVLLPLYSMNDSGEETKQVKSVFAAV